MTGLSLRISPYTFASIGIGISVLSVSGSAIYDSGSDGAREISSTIPQLRRRWCLHGLRRRWCPRGLLHHPFPDSGSDGTQHGGADFCCLLAAAVHPGESRRPGADRGEAYGANIVASFRLQKPVSQLKANISQLQYDIFYEIGVPNSMVALVSLESLTGLNMTNVVFGIWPYPLNSTISSAGISIIRSSFVSLVVQQTTLHLTTPLFGNSSDFQVLKFPGGMTITPAQISFPLQKEHYLFSFTLNFSIYQVQDKINELKDQMKLGLLLNSYEVITMHIYLPILKSI